jgi:orotidine-5'-phosphate decarboxylase
MNFAGLVEQIHLKRSYLCVGLDTDITKIPKHLLSDPDPLFAFNKHIIDATKEHCVAYKINTAFYESIGNIGWEAMEKTVHYIPRDIFKIADAKRADIGNTSKMYAKAFFEDMPFDAVTVSPYMGSDSVLPFLEYKNKWIILLALTSNEGSKDFQLLKTGNEYLYEKVINVSKQWGNAENMMYVIGATHPAKFTEIRKLLPNHFLLVPGVGAQGGDLAEISRNGLNKNCGLLVNVSRQIIYADSTEHYTQKAAEQAAEYHNMMRKFVEHI